MDVELKRQSNKSCYFIEGPAKLDLIGFSSYIDTLDKAITSGAKFIGLVSDYGSGKSTIINMIGEKLNDKYSVAKINLWNCGGKSEEQYLIHRNFLHQLIDELSLDNDKYFKKKIDKNYGLFDIRTLKKNPFYIFSLYILLILCLFEKLKLIELFIPTLHTIGYTLIALLVFLNIKIYAPLLAMRKTDNNSRDIDENDTKDLYQQILDEFFKDKTDDRKLIISIEELDRFEKHEIVLEYLKEFYKFYSESRKNNKVVFIISIKSAASLFSNNGKSVLHAKDLVDNFGTDKEKEKEIADDEEDNEQIISNNEECFNIKGIYEKVFDFILNLRPVNIQDYDSILIELLEQKKKYLSDEILNKLPTIDQIGKWNYLYRGKNIRIRDIKNRFNFTISLFLSIKENHLNPDIEKCLYISYLEDSFNELYQYLLNNSEIINKLLIRYANGDLKKEDKWEIEFNDEASKEILVEGFENKYLSFDYNIYLFKFPISKIPFDVNEEAFYNSVFYNEVNKEIHSNIKNLSDKQILQILDKRPNEKILPDIVFQNSRLLSLVINQKETALISTFKLRLQLYNNASKVLDLFRQAKMIEHKDFKKMLHIYKNSCFSDYLKNTNADERILIRKKMTSEIKDDITIFKELFFEDNRIILAEELNVIDNLTKIYQLIDFDKFNSQLLSTLSKKINFLAPNNKISMIELINRISKIESLSSENYESFIYSINFNKFELSNKKNNDIYLICKNKLELDDINNLSKFLLHMNYFDETINSKIIALLKQNNKEESLMRKYVDLIRHFNVLYDEAMKFLIEYNTIFKFNKDIRDKIFAAGYFSYYVISTRLDKGLFDIEQDKFSVLEKYYLSEFENRPEWSAKISEDMKKFLYHNVNFSKLKQKQLIVFSSMKQNIDLIRSVLATEDIHFINRYLKTVNVIDAKYEREIYELIGNFKKTNIISQTALNHLKQIARRKGNLLLLDARRKQTSATVK